MYAPGRDVSRLAYFALYALQHRGQESAGIATCEGGHITTLRELGLVSQVFDEQQLRALTGNMGIGHVRYSTTGGGAWENAQPVWRDDGRELALAHNGNLTNAVELHNELRDAGVELRGTSDSEIIAALLSRRAGEGNDWIEDAVAEVMPRLEGAFSTVVMTKHAVVAFRDPHGVRPLSLGKMKAADGNPECFVVASESCAFDIIGARLIREVQPGEMVSLTEGGLEMKQVISGERPAHCVFEHIYFSRPDSRLEGKVLQSVRGKMGEQLWQEAPVDADLVISVPDSGNPAANGFARASGLPQDDGLIKNRYVARTFIQPGQELRKHGLRMKFNPLPEIVAGKRVVVVDDSIVRGNTTRQIVAMLKDAGAKEVHLRISSPPIRNPCHYGVDMSTREEMVAHERTRRRDRRGARRRLARLPVPRRRLRSGRVTAREALRRLLHGRLSARRPRVRERQVRARGDRRRSRLALVAGSGGAPDVDVPGRAGRHRLRRRLSGELSGELLAVAALSVDAPADEPDRGDDDREHETPVDEDPEHGAQRPGRSAGIRGTKSAPSARIDGTQMPTKMPACSSPVK